MSDLPSAAQVVRTTLVVSTFCIASLAAQEPARPPVVGRWDLTVSGGEGRHLPSWLEVHWSGDRVLVGQFVGVVGSVRPISRLDFAHDTLRWSLPPQWEGGNGDFQSTHHRGQEVEMQPAAAVDCVSDCERGCSSLRWSCRNSSIAATDSDDQGNGDEREDSTSQDTGQNASERSGCRWSSHKLPPLEGPQPPSHATTNRTDKKGHRTQHPHPTGSATSDPLLHARPRRAPDRGWPAACN